MVNGKYLFFIASLSGFAWGEDLVDPTAPKQGELVVAPSLQTEQVLPQLQSILYQQDHQSAVINNQAYRVGEMVSGYRVLSIQASHVLLKRNGKTIKLSLFNADFIK
ncbi:MULTISPECIES: MSHA biogenesis protein MshK [unclassified Motilimonas]|uniref:MSHA biogenesis protein MshK n=1 Tax=Motilimonas TaxID=1914248 RepID=UPI001E3DCEC4|nr:MULTISPECIES: MSHA biogenesis protein MshK [unclassified Motilimonas]MCE0555812.1 MSHA biogenesis protein MshK [Motilimonas sp. E26]MDO6524139.1 MSHA biogenesis protein MshK [Motilimonas sp. 1_MG-2023]